MYASFNLIYIVFQYINYKTARCYKEASKPQIFLKGFVVSGIISECVFHPGQAHIGQTKQDKGEGVRAKKNHKREHNKNDKHSKKEGTF